MKTNGGCELPCFWGITAGETTWEEALQILGPIGLVTDFRGEELLLFNKYVFFLSLKELGQYPNHRFFVENGIVEMISVSDLRDSLYAEIPQVHNFLGMPEEVWLTIYAEGPPRTVTNIDIANVYLERGIATQHNYGTSLEGEMATGCLDEVSYMFLAIWNPELQFTFEDIVREFYWQSGGFRYRPLDEVTSIDAEAFYGETQQDEGYCIQTPNDLWFP
ncbi:MAG: hypothetical protein DWQ07_24420 [Chloroflexi bacterium]|nr:MAG: hypothetical protein DWQ07_24420 [Chloroflexota bacterium]MBL1196278.1 hypothetical protein [Chloroflexota bacterium]